MDVVSAEVRKEIRRDIGAVAGKPYEYLTLEEIIKWLEMYKRIIQEDEFKSKKMGHWVAVIDEELESLRTDG